MFKSKKNTITLTSEELNAIVANAVQSALAQTPKAAKAAKTDKQAKARKSKKQAPSKAQAEFILNSKSVEATGYLPHAVYVYNRDEATKLGGKVAKTAQGYFVAEFTSKAKAEAFSKVASYDVPNKAYDAIVKERTSKAVASKKAQAEVSKDNKALAAEMRALGLTPNGDAWAYAKAHGAKAAAKKFAK